MFGETLPNLDPVLLFFCTVSHISFVQSTQRRMGSLHLQTTLKFRPEGYALSSSRAIKRRLSVRRERCRRWVFWRCLQVRFCLLVVVICPNPDVQKHWIPSTASAPLCFVSVFEFSLTACLRQVGDFCFSRAVLIGVASDGPWCAAVSCGLSVEQCLSVWL